MTFLRKHWFDLGGILALLVAAYLAFDHSLLSRYEILMWISLITLFLHQLEEYRIVGTVGWPVYALAAVFAEKSVWLGIASLMISLGNLIAHTTLFNIKGKTWFNAGLFTSWFCFLPVIFYFIRITQEDRLTHSKDYLIGVPLGIAINVLGVVKLIDWLKDPQTTFIFPRRSLLEG